MPELLFGTASFAYEGWKGIVYHDRYAASRFKVDCLREYARFEPFRTVEFDFPFYRPPDDRQLARYAAALPPGFPVLSKVWEEVTMPRFPDLPRHGDRAGRDNPKYLDPRVFREEVLPPYERSFAGHTAPFILEFGADRRPTPRRRPRLQLVDGDAFAPGAVDGRPAAPVAARRRARPRPAGSAVRAGGRALP